MKRILSVIILALFGICLFAQDYAKLKPLTGNKLEGALTPIESKGKWGYANEKGKTVIKPIFEEARSFVNGFAIIKSAGQYGVISREGIYSVEPQFDEASDIESERIWVCKGGKWGFISPDGAIRIAPKYDKMGSFINNIAWVQSNGFSQVIDNTDKELLPFPIRELKRIEDRDIIIFENTSKKQGILNLSSLNVIIPPEYYKIDYFNGVFLCYVVSKEGAVISDNGTLLLPREEGASLLDFSPELLAQINDNTEHSTLLFLGSNTILKYNSVIKPNVGFQVVKSQDNLYGVLGNDYHEIVPCDYQSICPPVEGMSRMCLEDKWGFFNEAYQIAIPPQYKSAREYNDGAVIVTCLDDSITIIDKTGNTSTELQQRTDYLTAKIAGKYAKKNVLKMTNGDFVMVVDEVITINENAASELSLVYYFVGLKNAECGIKFPGSYCSFSASIPVVFEPKDGYFVLYALDEPSCSWIEKDENNTLNPEIKDFLWPTVNSLMRDVYRFLLLPNGNKYQGYNAYELLSQTHRGEANYSRQGQSGQYVRNGKIYFGSVPYQSTMLAFAKEYDVKIRPILEALADAVSCQSEADKMAKYEDVIRESAITLADKSTKLVLVKDDDYSSAAEMKEQANGAIEAAKKAEEEANRLPDVKPVVPSKGAMPGKFSVSASTKVKFSRGNLQYKASKKIWSFAEDQIQIIGDGNDNISNTYDGVIDLFGWGTSGYNNGKPAYQPWSTSTSLKDYCSAYSLSKDKLHVDWGVHNAISNGGNQAGLWRTLTRDEWDYLLRKRPNAQSLWSFGIVCGVRGLILLPDDWKCPNGIKFSPSWNEYRGNQYSEEQWIVMEAFGAIFLPAVGERKGTTTRYFGSSGNYWTSSGNGGGEALYLSFANRVGFALQNTGGHNGYAVRLVQNTK